MQTIDLSPALSKGLRADYRLRPNSLCLTECDGLRSCEFGVVPYEPPGDGGVPVAPWPFPQFLRTETRFFLMAADEIYEVDVDAESVTQLQMFTPDDYVTVIGPLMSCTEGGPWQIANFYDTAFLFNGVSTLAATAFRSGTGGSLTPEILLLDTTTIGTGCASREGRLFLAGFDPTDFYATADWPTYLAALGGNVPDYIVDSGVFDTLPGKNWVWWSTIGGGDALFLFALEPLIYGCFDPPAAPAVSMQYGLDRPMVFDLWKRNQWGMRPMPFHGAVQTVLPLDDGTVVVYGEDGISALSPTSVGGIATVSLRKMDLGGVALGPNARCCAGGDELGHLFLSEDSELWFVAPDTSTQRIGCSEFFEDWDDRSQVVVTRDRVKGVFYISNGYESFAISRGGSVSRCNLMHSGVINLRGNSTSTQAACPSFSRYRLMTAPVTGQRGPCRVLRVSAEIEPGTQPVYAVLRHRSVIGADELETEPVALDDFGVAALGMTCSEFKVGLQSDAPFRCTGLWADVESITATKGDIRQWQVAQST